MYSIFTGIVGWVSNRFSLFYQNHMSEEICFLLISTTVIRDSVCNSTTSNIPLSQLLKFSFPSVLFPPVNTPTTIVYKTYKLKCYMTVDVLMVITIITTTVITVITWVQHHVSKTAILKWETADFSEIPVMCYSLKQCCTQ